MNYLSKVTLRDNLTAKRLFVEEQIRPSSHSGIHTQDTANKQSDNTPKAKAKLNNPYRVHQALWQLFDLPQGSNRPFLYREYERGGETIYYVLSTLPPNTSHPFFAVQTKPFDPKFRQGQRLAFELRANPVTTITDKQGKSSRHDVMMMAKKSVNSLGFDDEYSVDKAMYEAGVGWITNATRMAAWGVTIHPNLELSGYTQHRFRRGQEDLAREGTRETAQDGSVATGTAKKSRLIQFSSLDYEGALEIQDAALFFEQLLKGFGKQKAFGCGLMLVRPLV